MDHRTSTCLALSVAMLSLASGCADPGSGRRMTSGSDASPRADAGALGNDAGPRSDAPIMVFVPDAGVASPDAGVASPDAPPAGPVVPPLRCGRTYDQEMETLTRGGAPDFATMRHRDGTSLPASEGGASCGSGCDEEVTLLCEGDALTGYLYNAVTFSVQGAQSGEPGTGSLVITLCGEELPAMSYASTTTTLPGFVNGPQPAATVPTRERCEVSVRAEGGCVWVRAVTVGCAPN
jgi:hypothetical protein